MQLLRLLPLLFLLQIGSAKAEPINGAGSSAAMPLYNAWAVSYQKKTGQGLDYQAVGSSAGIKQIKGRTVDFGASDIALSAEDLKNEKLVQFPSAISGVVPVINIPGIKSGELRLTGEVLADIFAQKILSWNDPAIASLNPGLHLPNKAIETLVRQDGSGTTYNFTDYLSKVSANWRSSFGRNFTINWPKDATQVKGSGGVSANLRKTPYAIGYIDYNYVVQDKLSYVQLKNHEGKFLPPSAAGFSSALNNSGWKTHGSFDEMLTDRAGSNSWPITMGTFVIVPEAANNAEKTISVLKFFSWAFLEGDHLVNSVDLVRLPDAIQAKVYREMMRVTDKHGKPLKWSLQGSIAEN